MAYTETMTGKITNELMYEILKQIQADVSHIRRRIDHRAFIPLQVKETTK